MPKGLQLRDEIGRYWRIAQAYWSDFAAGCDSAKGPDAARALSERFVLALLRESFGFASLVPTDPQVIAERSYPVGFAALGGRVPLVIAPADSSGLDHLAPALGDGLRRRSAFGLAQEYLNASEGATWGIASDGLVLRILRDNASLTRPAWIEADLYRIFTEERYSDFTALWLLAHETRFGRANQPPNECALETWRDAGREEGTRAREHLRRGVEEAIEALGQGFLAHPENAALRAALQDGSLSTTAYFQELLRLVYRVIFLLTVEERGLLHTEAASEAARRLYAEGYSLRRLRERSVRRSAHDRFSDLWEATKIVFRGVAVGEPRLALPALAGIFASGQCPTLDAAKLENRALLLAVFRLSWLREASGLVRVNWRDMGPEELGSVYESLLELVPQVTQGGRTFAFATGGETKGNARKTSGSYYTPDSLVQVLLESALEPVVADTLAANPERPVEALLELSIVDPACGSGHFLLAAARRLAGHVARFQANGTPSAAEYRHALRQVVGRCLYGVDLNPMAVELCKVSLWMEAVEPGLPLTFLDGHIRHGNALLGTTPALMAEGIPDAAWSPIEGDDRKVASGLKKRNKRSEGGQRALDTLWTEPRESETEVVARAVAELEAAPDTDVEALARKEERFEDLLESEAYRHQKFVADAWCAAFVWPKQAGPLQDAAPTNDVWIQIRDHQGLPNPLTVTTTEELTEQYQFFHWHLAFPQVFGRGGFDVVLGNPPWERVKLQEEEFFASRSDEIANASHAAARKKLIAALAETDPLLWTIWCAATRSAEGQSQFVRQSARYPHSGRGDLNTYALFAEHNAGIAHRKGRAGFIVPTGLVTDETTSELLRAFVGDRRLVSAFDFENTAAAAFFPGVGHRRFKFCLATVAGGSLPEGHIPEFVFYAENVLHLQQEWRRFSLSLEDFQLFNPATRTCPVFRSKRDAELARRIYRRSTILRSKEDGIDPWEVHFVSMIHMASDSHLFRGNDSRLDARLQLAPPENSEDTSHLPLFEAKMIHTFDHRYGDFAAQLDGSENTSLPEVSVAKLDDPTYEVSPRYRVPRSTAEKALQTVHWDRLWFFAWRDIASSGNERTMIPTVLPRVACGHTLPVLLVGIKSGDPRAFADCFHAMISSLPFDYVVRLKNGGTHLTFGLVEQLPVLAPTRFADASPLFGGDRFVDFIRPRVLELSYTTYSLAGYAADLGYQGTPFHWDPDRRAVWRAELDALFFTLFGFERDEVEYVIDTFKRLRLNEEIALGENRTRRLVLQAYDAMAEAARTGQPYATRLNPPPADPLLAHRSRTARVLPFPSRPFLLPVWGQELFVDVAARAQVRLEAGAWGTSLSGENLGISALAAVLRSLPGPVARGDVERAMVLALMPRLMQPHFDSTSETTWRSVIGSENLGVTSVSAFGIPWTAVIRSAIHQKVLAETPDGRWSAGSEVANAPSPALDARALVVLAWLATAPVEDAELTTQMEDLFHVA
ncbi:MAG TPA: N-6 DNA methylase [Thermoanaerobaculia bacterium]|nr:N-6 DNA methylase [Thermoanaerobaculia bacterium]